MHSGRRRRAELKLNSDAAFHADSGQSWAGAIARDHSGHVFLSVCKELPRSTSVEEAEGCAALVGLHALSTVYKRNIQLEVDCKWLADALKNNAPNMSPYYGLISDLNDVLATLSAFEVTHTAREGNKMAHELAVEARVRGDHTFIA